MLKKILSERKVIIAIFLFASIYGYFIYKIYLSKNLNLWDFKTYYYAVKVYEKGKNPYVLDNLKEESNGTVEFKFVYPIYTLVFFKIFTFFDYDVAFDIYLFLKYFLIVFLFILWSMYFFKKQKVFFLLIFCILAIENTIFADLATGNVSIFEQFFLWIAFYFFMEKRYMAFTFFLILASLFKLVLLFFLLMLVFIEDKNKYLYIFSGMLIIFILLLSFIKDPSYIKFYINSFISIDERGYVNPAMLPMLKDIFEMLSRKLKNNNLIYLSYIIYLLIISVFSFVTYKCIIKIKNLQMDEWGKKLLFLFFMICFYVVISPRFKEYSYIIMLLPAAFIILKIDIDYTKYILFFIFILSKEMFIPDINKIYQKFIWPYYQFWLTFICFLLYISYIKKIKTNERKHKINENFISES